MNTDSREAAAYDAVVAYSLAGRTFSEFSDEEIEKELAQYPELTAEGRACLEELGNNPFSAKIVPRSEPSIRLQETAGMYREGSDQELSPELRDEIARKREEIQLRLRKERERNV